MNKANQASPAGKRIFFIILGVFIAALLVLAGVLIFNNSSLQRKNGDLQTSLDQVSAELTTLKETAQPADVTALNEKYAALETEYNAYKADAQTAAETAASALATLQAEFDQYKADAIAVKDADAAELNSLQTAFDTYKADSAATMQAMESGAALTALQAEFDTYKAKAEGDLSALQAEFDAYKATAQADLDAATLAQTTLQTELDTLKAAAGATAGGETTPAGTDSGLAALQTEYDNYKASAQEQLAALQTQLDQLTAGSPDTAALQTEFDSYKAEAAAALATLQAEFDAYKAQTETTLAANQTDLETARQNGALELQTLQTSFDTFKTEAAAAQTALQTSFDTYKASAEAALTEAKQAQEAAVQKAAESAIPTNVNGAGNVSNGNLAVLYEGNIYYHNNYQNGNIFMENTEGFGDTYVRRTSLSGPNYLHGIAAVENGSLYYLNNDNLYRLNLTNGKSEFMKSNMNLYGNNAMHIYDDRIYFLKNLPGADGQPADNLYLVDFRCNNLENVPGVSAYAFVGADKYLYYVEAGTWNIVKFDLVEKTGAVVLQSGGQEIANLNLAADTLYFTLGGQLSKANADGTGLTAIGTAQASSLNVVGDWIYYSNTQDKEKLYRITTGGLYDQLVADVENTCCISVAGGWVYFIQYAGQGDQWTVVDTYKVKLDGTGLTQSKP